MSTSNVVPLSQGKLTAHSKVGLLLEGAAQRGRLAIAFIRCGDFDGLSRSIISAVSIVEVLRSSLDIDAGGELAERLDYLYGYVCVRLHEGQELHDPAPIVEAVELLTEIAAGWNAIPEDQRQGEAIAA